MSDKTAIPPSPSEDEYVRQVSAAEPPPLLSAQDPFELFAEWMKEAVAKEPNDANGMALSTVDETGMPDSRMVLLKDAGPDGFVFYSNLGSAKGRQLAANPKAALLFHWKSLRRQVRVRGTVVPVTPEEADAYFATRARPAQIGAWASEQSRPLPDRLALEKRIAEMGLAYDALLPQIAMISRDVADLVDHGALWFAKLSGLKHRAVVMAKHVVDEAMLTGGGSSYYRGILTQVT